jgi:hypothetical protein
VEALTYGPNYANKKARSNTVALAELPNAKGLFVVICLSMGKKGKKKTGKAVEIIRNGITLALRYLLVSRWQFVSFSFPFQME